MAYAKKTNLTNYENMYSSRRPDPPICHFSSAHNTWNFGLKVYTIIDLNIIYPWNFLPNMWKRKNAKFEFFKITSSLAHMQTILPFSVGNFEKRALGFLRAAPPPPSAPTAAASPLPAPPLPLPSPRGSLRSRRSPWRWSAPLLRPSSTSLSSHPVAATGSGRRARSARCRQWWPASPRAGGGWRRGSISLAAVLSGLASVRRCGWPWWRWCGRWRRGAPVPAGRSPACGRQRPPSQFRAQVGPSWARTGRHGPR